MPKSKIKGKWDYSDCEFRSTEPGPLPVAIQNMLHRALTTMGHDHWVLANRWLGNEKRLACQEKDICCADVAAFVLQATGVCDHVSQKNNRLWGDEFNFHAARYWEPTEDNEAFIKLIKKSSRYNDFFDGKGNPVDEWLPGDYILYSNPYAHVRNKPLDAPSHINVYVGEFQEFVDEEPVGTPFHLINGSLTLKGSSAYIGPRVWRKYIKSFANKRMNVWHCRVLAVERLYREVTGLPMEFVADDKNKDEQPIDLAWSNTEKAGSPYPVGRNRTWHDGIHLSVGKDVKDATVYAFAPGEIVLVRIFPESSNKGDLSFILVRHWIDVERKAVLDAKKVYEKKEKTEGAGTVEKARHFTFYSLYMHLSPLDTYLDEKGVIRKGAPRWLSAFSNIKVPDYSKFIKEDATLRLFSWGPGPNGKLEQMEIKTTPAPRTKERIYDYKEFETITIGGKNQYKLKTSVEESNLAAFSKAPLGPRVLRNSKLCFLNPATNEIIMTDFRLPRKTEFETTETGLDIILEDETRSHARIVGYDNPGIIRQGIKELEDQPKHKRILFKQKITMYLQTRGEGDKRTFNGADGKVKLDPKEHNLEFNIRDDQTTGVGKKYDRIWPELTACTSLTPEMRRKLDAEIVEQGKSLGAQVVDRLENGQSRLMGVKIGKRYGWDIKDGWLIPIDADTDDNEEDPRMIIMYPVINGSGKNRDFQEPSGRNQDDPNEIEADDLGVIQVIGQDELKIKPIDVFTSKGRKRALVEIISTVEDSEANIGDNQGDIDDATEHNKRSEKLLTKLRDGATLNLVDEKVGARNRFVTREPIGIAGKIPGGPDQGIHFQIFSGDNLINENIKGNTGNLTRVPGTRWWLLRDENVEDLLGPSFFERIWKQFRKFDELDRSSLTLPKDATLAQLPTPSEWLKFCSDNHRALAQIIAVHPPEWKLDWSKSLEAVKSRGMRLGKSNRQQQQELIRELSWWTKDLKLEGISNEAVFTYHPLRLLEWINTGIDVRVQTGVENPKVQLTFQNAPSVDLERDDDTGAYVFRTVVGFGSTRKYLPAKLKVEGLDLDSDIPVHVPRGRIDRITIAKPKLTVHNDHYQPPVSFLIPVQMKRVGGHYLLADGNKKIDELGYSRVASRIEVMYLLKMPNKIHVELSDPGFRLWRFEIGGAHISGGITKKGIIDDTKWEATLEAEKSKNDTPREDQIRAPASYSVTVDVIAESSFGKKTQLVVKASGGDFKSSQTNKSIVIRTREITVKSGKKKRSKGEDVAKVQLYLSQILADDGLPCYRASKGGTYDGNKRKIVVINGKYESPLARGLWRFIEAYADTKDWKAARFRITDARGKNEQTLKAAEACKEADIQTRMGKNITDFPIVDQPLVQEIKKRFRIPYVLPTVVLELYECDPIPEDSKKQKSNVFPVKVGRTWKKTISGKSAILPVNDRVGLKIKAPELRRLEGDCQVKLWLPVSSAYRLERNNRETTSIETSLRNLTSIDKGVVSLVLSGQQTDEEADNTLTLEHTDGRILSCIQLGGAMDPREKKTRDHRRDVARIQFLLSQIPEDPNDATNPRSCFGGKRKIEIPIGNGKKGVRTRKTKEKRVVLDGKWNLGTIKALQTYQENHTKSSLTYTELLHSISSASMKL